jgi:hypothetical protein
MRARAAAAAALVLAATAGAAPALDLAPWNRMIATYVDGRGNVSYAAWKARDLPALDAFVAALAAERPQDYPTRQEQLAFWINAYNACVIRGVLARYPIRSVRDVPAFFTETAYTVAGARLSLDQIENQKIRPTFQDPRIHFALVCAARSCPRLVNRAWTGLALDASLDAQAREFLADPARNRYDVPGGRASLSQIFRWYSADFVAAAGSVVLYVRRYAPAAVSALLARPDLRVDHLVYDWALNDAAGGR